MTGISNEVPVFLLRNKIEAIFICDYDYNRSIKE